jgi:rod shape-determining protein MreD
LAIAIDPIAASHMTAFATPNLLLAPVVAAVFSVGGPLAVLCGGGCGFLCDCLGGSPLGIHMAVFGLIAAIGSSMVPRRLSASGILLLAFALAFVGQSLAASANLRLEGQPAGGLDALAVPLATGLFASALVGGIWIVRRTIERILRLVFRRTASRPS